MIVATSLAAIERLFAFFDEEPEVADRPGAMPLKVTKGRVVFEHVDFGYPPKGDDELRLILSDVNLVVEPAHDGRAGRALGRGQNHHRVADPALL